MKITFSDKLIAYLTLLSGLSISAVAVWYSVAGLVSIFAAAAVPIIIMGVALEVSKLVATVWLKMNWKIAPAMMRTYLVIAIIILMFITSMGIFGFLSKAHLDQAVPTGDVSAKVQMIDDKIKTEQDNITAAKAALQQMDNQVNERLSRSTDDRGAERAVQIRRNQAKERKALQADIAAAQKEITKLREERAPIASELRKVEAEVGPIKYIAALVYGDNPDQNVLERAVRWVIIIIVAVFDPLAVVLLLASQYSFQWFRRQEEDEESRKGWHQEWVPDTESWPNYEPDDGPLTEEQIQTIKETVGDEINETPPTSKLFEDEPEVKEFFDKGKEIARAIDENDGKVPDEVIEPADEQKPILITRISNPESNLNIPILEGEEMWAQEAIDNARKNKEFDPEEYYEYLDGQPELDETDILESAEADEKAAMHRWKVEHPNSSLKLQRKLYERGAIKELPWQQYLTAQPDFAEDDSKKKDSDLDGNSGRASSKEESRLVADTYIQNAEQGEQTLWQRIKKATDE